MTNNELLAKNINGQKDLTGDEFFSSLTRLVGILSTEAGQINQSIIPNVALSEFLSLSARCTVAVTKLNQATTPKGLLSFGNQKPEVAIYAAIKVLDIYEELFYFLRRYMNMLPPPMEGALRALRAFVDDFPYIADEKIKNEYEQLSVVSERFDFDLNRVESLQKRIIDLEGQISSIPTRIENAIDAALEDSRKKIEKNEQAIIVLHSSIISTYEEATNRIKIKEEQLAASMGRAASSLLAGKYSESAVAERGASNWFRAGSILLLILSSIPMGWALLDSVKNDFKIESVLFRVFVGFFLLVPATYLARESGKHRSQFNKLRQTALDLDAVHPYLESVEKESQDKVKVEIASKIFVPAPVKVDADGVGVSAQALLMKMMEKMEFPTKPKA